MAEPWLATKAQTKEASGDQMCLTCHTKVGKKSRSAVHSVHTFTKCVGCHMPRIAKSAESGDIHSHVFVALMPEDTLKNPAIPNSCQACHKHKDEDLNKLNQDLKKIQAQLDWRPPK
jgi:formate-dependent nitrite reductase cytochrome c552 subunit